MEIELNLQHQIHYQLQKINNLKTNSLEKVDIYFARSNILHQQKKYEKSAENLISANNIKLKINKN